MCGCGDNQSCCQNNKIENILPVKLTIVKAFNKVVKLNDKAIIPTKNNEDDEGWDLYSSESVIIPVGQSRLVKTGIAIEYAEGYWGQIEGRSGLAYKKGVQPFAGIIDTSYRGEHGVILFNGGTEEFIVNEGDRIAQLVIRQRVVSVMEEVSLCDFNKETLRGEKGFGSSGK